MDVLGGVVGFAVPGLGRSRTADWTIEGGHFAERCQAFILIALGESIVIIGATLSAVAHVSATEIAAFVVAFAGSVALWWLYFDRSADASAEIIERSDDPGRLGRTAYHLIHPVMVAGIIVAAAGDDKILTAPSIHAQSASAWMILGGPALFLAGHAAFKYVVWRDCPVDPAGRHRGARAARAGGPGAAGDRARRLRGRGGGGGGRRRPAPPAPGPAGGRDRLAGAGGRRLDQVQAPAIVLAVRSGLDRQVEPDAPGNLLRVDGDCDARAIRRPGA